MTDRLTQPDNAPAFVPVPVRAREDGWSPQVQRRFIEALAATGSVDRAAMQVGRSRQSAYQLRNRPDGEGFAAAWLSALAAAQAVLVDTLLDRALHGHEVPVFYKGEQIGTRTVHYEGLSLYMLRKLDERMLRSGPHDRIALRLPDMLDAVEAGEVLTHAEMAKVEEEAYLAERRAAFAPAHADVEDGQDAGDLDDDEDEDEDDFEDDADAGADDVPDLARVTAELVAAAEGDGSASTSAPLPPEFAAALRAVRDRDAARGPSIRCLG